MTTDAEPSPLAPDRPARVAIQQLALPKYRAEVFDELGRRPNVDLRVGYGEIKVLDNVAAEDRSFKAESFPLTRLTVPGTGRTLLWHPPMWDWAGKGECDVLFMTWDLHFAGIVPSLLRARAAGVRTVLWGHGYSKREAGWRAAPRRAVTKLADALLFYNHTIADKYAAAGVPREKLHVALNAIDQRPIDATRRHFEENPDDLAAWQRENGLDTGPLLLFVSRLFPANRVDLLLRAGAKLRASGHPDLKVAVIGKGQAFDDLKALGERLGYGGDLRMPGPIYDERAIAPYFLTAAAYCYPANVGLSVLHAFGYGLPVVTDDNLARHNPEIEALRDGENGLVYRFEDVDDLAEKLRGLVEDPALRSRLGEAARATVRDRFTLANMADGFVRAVRYCQSLR